MTVCTLLGKGHTVQTDLLSGGADINACRNSLTYSFLDSGYDAMLFIDSDIEWPADAVLKLIEAKKPVIGGIYPKKTETEDWVVVHKPGERGARLMPVTGLGGGFLLIQRTALEKFSEFHKDRQYTDSATGKRRTVFFNGGFHHGRILSEDLDFCQACIEAGIDVYAQTDINFTHYGMKGWAGNYAEFMNRAAQEKAA